MSYLVLDCTPGGALYAFDSGSSEQFSSPPQLITITGTSGSAQQSVLWRLLGLASVAQSILYSSLAGHTFSRPSHCVYFPCSQLPVCLPYSRLPAKSRGPVPFRHFIPFCDCAYRAPNYFSNLWTNGASEELIGDVKPLRTRRRVYAARRQTLLFRNIETQRLTD